MLFYTKPDWTALVKNNISVVIPNYNRSDLIGRAINSVLSQTLPAREVIVVDDGSTDSSREFISANYPDVTLLTQENKGVSSSRNRGIRQASGDWIALLDSDDEWQPEKLERQYDAWKAQPQYKIIHTNESWIRNGEPLRQLKKHQKFGGYIYSHCLPLCVMSPSSIIVHKDIFLQLGLFNENYPVCEDYDMWLRICASYPVLFLDEELIIKYGGHEDQLSRKMFGMDRFRILALENILNSANLSPDDRKATIMELGKKIDIYLKGARKHDNTQFVERFREIKDKYEEYFPSTMTSTEAAQ